MKLNYFLTNKMDLKAAYENYTKNVALPLRGMRRIKDAFAMPLIRNCLSMGGKHDAGSRKRTAILACAAIAFSLSALAQGTVGRQPNWVGTWATAPVDLANAAGKFVSSDTTFRQIVHVSLGGNTARVTLSNEFGTDPLTITAASVALRNAADQVDLSTSKPLTFGGEGTVILPPGALVVSDPVAFKLRPFSDLAIDLFVPAQPMRQITLHPDALQTNYMVSGNQVGAESLVKPQEYTHWYFLKNVEVEATPSSGAVVAFGDSITDGHKGTLNANLRWPDVLARRLQADRKTRRLAVLNEAISGNRLLFNLGGPSALARFDRDVLSQAGVRYLIILEGINDIGHVNRPAYPGEKISSQSLIFALEQLVERAHTHGIKVFVATLTPYVGRGDASPAIIKLRDAENQWIRTTDKLDGVIDFEKMTQDPAHPEAFLPAYDSGDHLHPGDGGYRAMGEGIDLKLFEK